VLARVSKEDVCDLYGKTSDKKTWPKKIISDIASLKNEDDAIYALKNYKDLNLSEQFEEPMRFKRVVAYLSIVTLVFISVVSIYQLYVTPAFKTIFENLDVSDQTYFSWYQDYWTYFTLVTIVVLILSLVIGLHLRKIFKFHLGIEKSFVFRFLTFPNIRKSYAKVINILEFPLLFNDSKENANTQIFEHLKMVKNTNMNVTTEMYELLNIEMRNLLDSCERQMKFISVFVALVVITAIFCFLASAYSPIFVLGEVI